MDSVSERALRSGAEIVVHAYPNGFAPGEERLTALGRPFKTLQVSGTSEDMAFLLAHGKGADLIVAAMYSANNASRPSGFVHTTADVGVSGTTAVPNNTWT